MCMVELVKEPASEKLELIDFYRTFVSTFESKINQLTFVRLVVSLSRQLSCNIYLWLCINLLLVTNRIEFLKEISELPKVVLNSEAFVDSRSVLTELFLLNNEPEKAKVSPFVTKLNYL